ILVVTRKFAFLTGSRTFDAASYSRAHGADTNLTQHFFKHDLVTYMNRIELIQTLELQDHGVVIQHGSDGNICHPVTVSQHHYELDGREDILVGMSDSLCGAVDVELRMEALGGGGHLTNAATQLKDVTVEEAIEQLQQAITEQMSRSENT